jgi:hypothetical protein
MFATASLNRVETKRLASRPLQSSHIDATDRALLLVFDAVPAVASDLANQLIAEAQAAGHKGRDAVAAAEVERARREEALLDKMDEVASPYAAELTDLEQAQGALGQMAAKEQAKAALAVSH